MYFPPTQRATALIVSGPAHDPGRRHLFIALTGPKTNPKTNLESLLFSPVCSAISGRTYEASLYKGDHSFVRHDSFVDFVNCRILTVDEFKTGVTRKIFIQSDMLESAVFARVAFAFENSQFVAKKFKDFYFS